MEISNSGTNPAISHAQITTRSLGPIETCTSVPKVDVLQAKQQMRGGTHRDQEF